MFGKKNSILMPRCNRAILQSLRWAREKYSQLYYPDQGGWITYEKDGRKLKYELHELKTQRGLIDFSSISNDSVVIFHDMPAYMYFQNTYDVKDFKERNILVINDITGSAGLRDAQGDILVCSFGKTKMINVGYGGVIATDLDLGIEEEFDHSFDDALNKKIDNIQERIDLVFARKEEIIVDLAKFDIISGDGPNVVIPYMVDDEKNWIIKYCQRKRLEYVLCPMNIKINENAISIEILRST